MARTELPSLDEEKSLWAAKVPFAIGIDEAGRGCLAGPVCVGALVLPESAQSQIPVGIRDSKQIAEEQREQLFEQLQLSGLVFGVGWASSKEVDQWNVLRATYLAAGRAVEAALQKLETAGVVFSANDLGFLTDGSHPLLRNAGAFVRHDNFAAEFPQLQKIFESPFREKPIVKGDGKVLSIATASIAAKVSRDRYMRRMDGEFPQYEFAVHKGYGTPAHVQKLRKLGPCSEHRFSYEPVAQAAREWRG